MGATYHESGVDITAGNKAVSLMKEDVKRTFRPGVLTDIGNFAGLFALDKDKYREPVLVSGTDGVGTKLKVAFDTGRHDTIGIDAVAMCVNDILVLGAEPLFFLDYIAVGKLVPEKIRDIVKGVADGCVQAGCALIGGETAEMPGFYGEDEYDIAGFAVGVVDKEKALTGENITEGDVLIGLPSSGLHSNGFSLVRKVFFTDGGYSVDHVFPELGLPLGEALMKPTRIYCKEVLPLFKKDLIKGMSHITGGGLIENIPRILPQGKDVLIDIDSWQVPSIFSLIRRLGNIEFTEMNRVFNMGIGMVIITSQEKALKTKDILPQARIIGKVVKGNQEVKFTSRG